MTFIALSAGIGKHGLVFGFAARKTRSVGSSRHLPDGAPRDKPAAASAHSFGLAGFLAGAAGAARRGRGRRGRGLRRDRSALAQPDRHAEELPLPLHRRVKKLEFDLRRHGRKETRHVHHAAALDLRQQGQLRIEHGDPGKVDLVAAEVGEDFAEPRRGVGRLEARRAEIAQHRVVAGLVRLVERKQRRADQDQHAVAVDLGGLGAPGAGLASCEAQRRRAPSQKRRKRPNPRNRSSSLPRERHADASADVALVQPDADAAVEDDVVADAQERRRAEGVGAVIAAPVGARWRSACCPAACRRPTRWRSPCPRKRSCCCSRSRRWR